jgi:hypothetical protein
MSRTWLGLIFTRVCAYRNLIHHTFLIRYRVGGMPSDSKPGCAPDYWAVDRGTGAHQQSWKPPSSCCLSLLAGGF